tara:strand:- start:20 stop:262 length:243 start_codon:yes stop_codon:yes gene_type:complete
LGGVATGNINAQLAANVTGTQRNIGGMPDWMAIAAMIGKKVAVVARLLVNSVKNITKAVALMTSAAIPKTEMGERLSPNH